MNDLSARHDFGAFAPAGRALIDAPLVRTAAGAMAAAPLAGPLRVGVISNLKSHRNRSGAPRPAAAAEALRASPHSQADLTAALRDFAAHRINLLVVDGGDGTVRDVLTQAQHVFNVLPRVAVLPSGKTNALALDLGIPGDWTLDQAVESARAGRVKWRAPIEIARDGERAAELVGFLFGAGAFVRATGLAQHTHRAGAFDSLAVGLSLGWAIAQTVFGGAGNEWRRGERVRLALDGAAAVERDRYLLFATTLEHLPLSLKPFGAERAGLKLLAVDAPPRRIVRSLGTLLSGADSPALAANGFHRHDVATFAASFAGDFILDGEEYRGGTLTARRGAPIDFAAP